MQYQQITKPTRQYKKPDHKQSELIEDLQEELN